MNNINKPVTVTAVEFGRDLAVVPRQIEFDGRIYDFVDKGLACIVKKGDRFCRILTLTDGRKQFRLRSDNRGGLWTLLSIAA